MFQSTHPRRVRLFSKDFARKQRGFNPRTHVGCDIGFVLKFRIGTSFNPRTHIGCDCRCVKIPVCTLLFQSTHPRRVRRLLTALNMFSLPFQSTHPRRVRQHGREAPYYLLKFQSTHPRRVRQSIPQIFTTKYSFNPRTHVGCDSIFSKCLNITLQSYLFCVSYQNKTIKK